MWICIIILIILIIPVVSGFGKKECFIHEDYELKTTKVCAGDYCKDKNSCQLYQNHLNDC